MASRPKCPRVGNEDSIFSSFSSNQDLFDGLRQDLSGLQTSVGFGLALLKIQLCDAKFSTTFSNACLHAVRQTDLDDEDRVAYTFGSVFDRGCGVLKSFLDDPHGRIPQRKGEHIALCKLLTMLENTKDVNKALTIDHGQQISRTEWTIRLAHHFLSPLAVNPTFLIDSHSCDQRDRCPCCNEKIAGSFDDTSIGSKDGWHGYLDIVFGVERFAAVKIAVEEPDSPGGENRSAVEVKAQDGLKSCRNQILAETVVFSFLQKKYHSEYDNYLIPTIGISRQYVVFYFYDCVNDMLMETPPIRLLKNNKLIKSTILAVWLVLNYKYFCSGITKGMRDRNFTADFFKHVGDCIQIYRNDVDFACGSASRAVEDFAPWEDVRIKLESGSISAEPTN
ncbi:uncharacterized protein LOC117315720 [Pecten maximus]|uniref:uncharacterized protein LOC117315720 n=1 Tax=Pecten maximus TaxID=6579 RepID=UPI001458FF08|nr:uncharacterized protein LOC117315720 [Pecten maximus]